jgi:hypothetical protein
VRGDGIAAQALPFAIRADAETELEVRTAPGIRQRVEFVPGTAPVQRIDFDVRRDGRLVLRHSAFGDPPVRDLWLAPGSYTLSTREREPQSTAAFMVGSTEGKAVRIALR